MKSPTALRINGPLVLGVCLLIAALEGYDIQAFGVAAPKFVKELALSASEQGWAASAAMIGLVVGSIVGGWAADRVGRKLVLLVSVAAFGLFSFATAYSVDYPTLLLARLVTGLGFGGALPNLIIVASEINPAKSRAGTIMTVFGGLPAGGAVVSLIARSAPEMDWRTIFMIGGVLPIVVAPLVYFLLPETRPQEKELDRRVLPALFGDGKAAATLLLWTAFLMTLVVMYLMLNWLPTLVVAKGLTPTDGATASLSFNLASVAGAVLLGAAIDRAGFRWPLLAIYVLLAAALLGLAHATAAAGIMAFAGAVGFFVCGGQYALYAIAPSLYPPQVRAAGSGAAVGVGRLGSIIGPLLAGELRAAGMSAETVLTVAVPVVLGAGAAAVALAWLIRPRKT